MTKPKTWLTGNVKHNGNPIWFHRKNIVYFYINKGETIIIDLVGDIRQELKFDAQLEKDLLNIVTHDNER